MPTYSFFVAGPIPGLNEIVKSAKGNGGKGVGYASLKKKWTDIFVWAIKSKKLPKMKRVRVLFQWIESTQRRDPDNVAAGKKFAFDALVASGVLENDGWKQVAGFSDVFIVGDRCGVEVSVRDESEEP